MENKDFVSYEIALELKRLGFNMPSSYCYTFDGVLTTFPHYLENTNKTYDNAILSGLEDKLCTAPRVSEVLRYFRDVQGLYVNNVPEFYTNGINFNWQILWYTPKEEWKCIDGSPNIMNTYSIYDATFQYGDNGEYPTQEDADLGAIKLMIEIIKIGKNIYLEELDKKRLNGDYEW